MAFACTASKFFFVETSKAANAVDNIQYAEITLTAANTDLTWDLNDLAGTAWTAIAAANATGASTLAALKTIKTGMDKIVSITSTVMLDRSDVITASAAGDYNRSYTAGSILPAFGFFTANAPTTDTICVGWKMLPGQLGISAEYAV